jgi:ABC-type transport system substrate-binding protein
MEIPLRVFTRVKLHTLWFTVKNLRTCLSWVEKGALILLGILIVLSTWRWTVAAAHPKAIVPANGGTFVEGVVGSSFDNIDLGRLTKSALVGQDSTGKIVPDMASSWTVSDDKTTYNFVLNPKVSASDILDTLSKNPTYLPGVAVSSPDSHDISIKLPEANTDFLSSVGRPLFADGPYVFDRKKGNELRLKINKNYHLQRSYIDRVIIRLYADQNALQKAAQKGAINGAMNLSQAPSGWQSNTLTLSKRHILFVNSSKTYLKSTAVRDQLLNGQKPDGITSLDILEVNGEKVDADFQALLAKLRASGVDVKERQVALKDAIKSDLPKRNYDVLYLLVSEDATSDPYLLWNSSQRSGDGQNFAELANATIDNLTAQYRSTDDIAKKADLLKQINDQVQKERVSVQYSNITATYSVSQNIKGFSTDNTCLCETDRYDHLASWYINQKSIY